MTNIQTMTFSMEKSGEIFFKCHVKLSQGADITITNFIRLPPTWVIYQFCIWFLYRW